MHTYYIRHLRAHSDGKGSTRTQIVRPASGGRNGWKPGTAVPLTPGGNQGKRLGPKCHPPKYVDESDESERGD